MENPEHVITDGVHFWNFRCKGPGHNGDGCTINREDPAPTKREAKLIALGGKWELLEGHWHCPRCVLKVRGALYGVHTRIEPAKESLDSNANNTKPLGLTSITIENFKGIGQAVTIPLRPVTLLFGANSAGKSTIIQALQYAWEILENRNANVDRTRLGGEVIDLGGFQNLVHGHELDRSISITLRSSDGVLDEAYRAPEFDDSPTGEAARVSGAQVSNATDWLDIEDVEVRVVATWEYGQGPYVSAYEVGLNGTLFGAIHAETPQIAKLWINGQHPFFSNGAMASFSEYGQEVMGEIAYHLCGLTLTDTWRSEEYERSQDFDDMPEAPEDDGWLEHGPAFIIVDDVIPEWGRHLVVRRIGGDDEFEAHPLGDVAVWTLSQLLLGAGETLLKELRGLRYLGPIREVPDRSYAAPLRLDAARWANGLGAWDSLLRAHGSDGETPHLIARCNYYLNDVLGLGYTVRRESRIQLAAESLLMAELRLFAAQYEERDGAEFLRKILNPLEQLPRLRVLQLHDEKRELDVDPMDIGVGVSQALPVIVGAVDPDYTVFAVEQPELHIHPAVQVGIGDLFLHEALAGELRSRRILVETHSEHLVLRIMKRMRETCEGTLPGNFPEVAPDDVAVLYVEIIDGKTYVREMPLNERGELIKAWPGGFFEEGLRETF